MAEDWIILAEYHSRVAADIAAEQLRAMNIPVQIDDASTGLFGPGFAGSTAMGVRLLVPRDLLEDAREALAE